jgi:O-antigen/teichoic acid export membrane protein
MLVICAVGVLAAEPLVHFLFGEEFLPAVVPLRWLMPAALALSVNSLAMNYLASTGMPAITVYSPAVAAVLNIAANLWLVPLYGGIGAAWASLASYLVMLALSTIYLARHRAELG